MSRILYGRELSVPLNTATLVSSEPYVTAIEAYVRRLTAIPWASVRCGFTVEYVRLVLPLSVNRKLPLAIGQGFASLISGEQQQCEGQSYQPGRQR